MAVAQIQSTIVQSLSSRYAVVLGGYGPGYSELAMVEVVKHDKVCQEIIADIPPPSPGSWATSPAWQSLLITR